MRRYIYGCLLLICLTYVVISCKENKGENRSDSTSYTGSVDMSPAEYYFAGIFTYRVDAAVLRDYSTDNDLTLSMEEGYLNLERKYLELTRGENSPVYLQLKGRLISATAEKEEEEFQLLVHHLIRMQPLDNISLSLPITGKYSSEVNTLSVKPDHTFRLRRRNGILNTGKWFLSAPGTIELFGEDFVLVLDVNQENRRLMTRVVVPVIYQRLDD